MEEQHQTALNDIQMNKWHFFDWPIPCFYSWYFKCIQERRYLLMVEESRTPFRTPTERQLRFSRSHHIFPLPYLSLFQRRVGRSFGSRSNLCGKTLILADRTGSIVWSVWSSYLNQNNRRATRQSQLFRHSHANIQLISKYSIKCCQQVNYETLY